MVTVSISSLFPQFKKMSFPLSLRIYPLEHGPDMCCAITLAYMCAFTSAHVVCFWPLSLVLSRSRTLSLWHVFFPSFSLSHAYTRKHTNKLTHIHVHTHTLSFSLPFAVLTSRSATGNSTQKAGGGCGNERTGEERGGGDANNSVVRDEVLSSWQVYPLFCRVLFTPRTQFLLLVLLSVNALRL